VTIKFLSLLACIAIAPTPSSSSNFAAAHADARSVERAAVQIMFFAAFHLQIAYFQNRIIIIFPLMEEDLVKIRIQREVRKSSFNRTEKQDYEQYFFFIWTSL
jgi:hypothetical protein